ncbi:hypothetical protein [Kitasatospora paranensis]|uniref:Uncharacterized protein n=1 Tax=Kitasatospora paranensis TaxID=258053 RepID=A0ABW2G351_9ACTN
MIEYELIQQRQRELRDQAEQARMAKEAASAGGSVRRAGLFRRLAAGDRPARRRPARPVEC